MPLTPPRELPPPTGSTLQSWATTWRARHELWAGNMPLRRLSASQGKGPARPPCVLLSGGETTVTVAHEGRGGRNSEYVLGLALGLEGANGISAIAGDTDGIDGTDSNAGAFLTSDTLARAAAAGLNPDEALVTNDAYSFFEALDDLLVVGPTRTNVNDFRGSRASSRLRQLVQSTAAFQPSARRAFEHPPP